MAGEREIWRGMLGRCENPRHPKYNRYGGRGIEVCGPWHSFFAFFDDMGERPGPAYSIDRIDNDGNYEPGNCRWATRKQQGRNKANNRIVRFRDREMSVAEAAELVGAVTGKIALLRLNQGWDLERALSQRRLSKKKALGRAAAGRRRKAAEGGFASGNVPFGFRRVARGNIAADDAESEIVRRMFELRAQGLPLREIAARLNGVGARTRRGAEWRQGTVHYVLANPRSLTLCEGLGHV